IQEGQLADLIVPDCDFYACAESEIADTTSLLTVVGGRIVYAAGSFAAHDVPPPPAMPDWSPVRTYGGYAAWGQSAAARVPMQAAAAACGCSHGCHVHGHNHAASWASRIPVDDLKSFWGALGCACWAV
ncbi:MAG TPA: amidohydrolase, partial [Lysobacter sp.]|nr:amidohydrolase [Lysobacter sp.]